MDATLTKSQKNAVCNWVTSANFNPADFEWKEHELDEPTRRGVTHCTASTLTHKQTGYYFAFGKIYSQFSPGTQNKIAFEEHLNDWGVRAGAFHRWLCSLSQEVDSPDLWASIGQEKTLPNGSIVTRHSEPAIYTSRTEANQ